MSRSVDQGAAAGDVRNTMNLMLTNDEFVFKMMIFVFKWQGEDESAGIFDCFKEAFKSDEDKEAELEDKKTHALKELKEKQEKILREKNEIEYQVRFHRDFGSDLY